jgi:hypothetical protein
MRRRTSVNQQSSLSLVNLRQDARPEHFRSQCSRARPRDQFLNKHESNPAIRGERIPSKLIVGPNFHNCSGLVTLRP